MRHGVEIGGTRQRRPVSDGIYGEFGLFGDDAQDRENWLARVYQENGH